MIRKKIEIEFYTSRHKAAHSIDHAMLLDSPEIIEWRKKFIKAIRNSTDWYRRGLFKCQVRKGEPEREVHRVLPSSTNYNLES